MVITVGLVLAVIVWNVTGNMVLALVLGLVVGPVLQILFKSLFGNVGVAPPFYILSKKAAEDKNGMRLRVLFTLPKDFSVVSNKFYEEKLEHAISSLCETDSDFRTKYAGAKPGSIEVYAVKVGSQKKLQLAYRALWRMFEKDNFKQCKRNVKNDVIGWEGKDPMLFVTFFFEDGFDRPENASVATDAPLAPVSGVITQWKEIK